MPTVKTIKVTADHIKHGEPGSSRSCPIALALNEAGFPTNIDVGSEWVNVPYIDFHIALPPNAITFIEEFDRLDPIYEYDGDADESTFIGAKLVRPAEEMAFEFEITIPAESEAIL